MKQNNDLSILPKELEECNNLCNGYRIEDILRALLSAYWLRAETALTRTLDIYSMKDFQFESPSLDIGCGDGVFSFIRAGGRFQRDFDVFLSVSNLENYFKYEDVYNTFDGTKVIHIEKRPDYQIDYAFDHKQALLDKAACLGLYKHLMLGDANQPLPFPDQSFQSVFSNILYWLDDPGQVLKEIYRVLKPGGHCCIFLPDQTFLETQLFCRFHGKINEEMDCLLALLDKGRFQEQMKTVHPKSEWEKMILGGGFRISACYGHLSETIIKIWDIGLRPIFPVLLQAFRQIGAEERDTLKKKWVDLFHMFAMPLLRTELKSDILGKPTFYTYLLEKP